MRHFSCDLCGKDLSPSTETRYVVRMELFAAMPEVELTESDLDQDHLDSMAEYLEELESGVETESTPVCRKMEYDLCPTCHRRFAADPLGRERSRKPRFSKN